MLGMNKLFRFVPRSPLSKGKLEFGGPHSGIAHGWKPLLDVNGTPPLKSEHHTVIPSTRAADSTLVGFGSCFQVWDKVDKRRAWAHVPFSISFETKQYIVTHWELTRTLWHISSGFECCANKVGIWSKTGIAQCAEVQSRGLNSFAQGHKTAISILLLCTNHSFARNFRAWSWKKWIGYRLLDTNM